jgi:DinB superfamily
MTENTPTSISPATLRILAMLEGIRRQALKTLSTLQEDEAFFIPKDLRNNLHWHVGHILHVQLAHWYVRRGEPLPASASAVDFKRYFRDGKSPADYDSATPTFATLLELYRAFSLDLATHYGHFLEAPMTTGFTYLGMEFKTLADDLYLLVYHEGEHAPMMQRILKALGKPAGDR